VKRDDLDIVWIGAGPFLHAPVTLSALAAGKHVFCQARMSTDLASAESMLAAAEAHPELVTMLCPPPHGLAMDRYVKELLARRVVGKLRNVRLQSFSRAFLSPSAPAHWRQRRDISGKNILTLGILTEVLERWFGVLTVEQASGRVFVRERGGVSIEIPDAIVVFGSLSGNVPVCLEISAVHAGPPMDRLEVSGTGGVLTLDLLDGRISLLKTGDTRAKVLETPPGLSCEWTVESDFLKAVVNPSAPRPHPDFRDGVSYMRVVEKVWDCLHSL
jgi:predicted dehydrogenase